MSFEAEPTNYETMAGRGQFKTVSTRGTGFAPTKKIHMILPPDVRTQEDLERFLATSNVQEVHEVALEGLKREANQPTKK